MENFYYIDDSGFIAHIGKFNSYEEFDDYLMKESIQASMIFDEEYLLDFIKLAQQTIEDVKDEKV
jgi:hypothetical protein